MIRFGRVTLRPPRREDLPVFLRWFNDPEVTRFLTVANLPLNLEMEERWFEEVIARQGKDRYVFSVEDEEGYLIGNVSLSGIDWVNRNAELGIVIGEKGAWGKGYCGEILRAVLGFAFGRLNLHRVYLRVFEPNVRGIRCYEKVGFTLEGRLRQARYFDGRYEDVLLYGILREEFQEEAD